MALSFGHCDIKDPNLLNLLSQWQFTITGLGPQLFKSLPIQMINDLVDKTPVQNKVSNLYDPLKERTKVQIIYLIISYINETISVNLTVNN